MYAGGLGFRPMANTGGDAEHAQRAIEQGIIAGNILKAWTAERKGVLAKFKRATGELRRLSDGYNHDLTLNKKGFTQAERERMESEYNERAEVVNELMKSLVEDYRQRMVKAGVTTALGYNFFDLRGPAYLIYPLNVPLRNSLPRWGKVNAGYGTMANWKYGNGPGVSYGGAVEGQRVAFATPPETDAFATYKELGIERSVTFTAQFAGEGYTDNVADEHIRGMHELFLQEESFDLGANSGTGTGSNGFVLGTPNTPTATLVALAGNIPDATNVSCRVVELTMLGNPNNSQYGYQAAPTVTGGLTPSYIRTNADGSQTTVAGGTSKVSAASNVVVTSSGHEQVTFKVAAKKGAVAWAWFVDVTDASAPTAANALLSGITTVPWFTYNLAAPAGTQTAAFSGVPANDNFTTDNSFQPTDYEGLLSWAASKGVWINMSDLTATSPVTGSTNTGNLNAGLDGVAGAPAVQELDYDLLQQWNGFQTVSDIIWCSADAKRAITACLFKNSSATPAYRFEVTRDAQNNIIGGFTVSSYQSLYSMKATGSDAIPLKVHPMLPPGTILYDKEVNPYPHSRIPGVRGVFVQRDIYGIEWPVTTRAWTFGEYEHITLGHYIPGLLTLRTGIAGVA